MKNKLREMKTPIEELIDYLDKYGDNHLYGGRELIVEEIKNIVREMLEKEKEMICGIYDDAIAQFDPTYIGKEKYGEHYYNETFNTKEK